MGIMGCAIFLCISLEYNVDFIIPLSVLFSLVAANEQPVNLKCVE